MSTSTSPVDIRADHLEIVQDILRTQLPAGVKVWVFGSRANWTTKDSSDLDLAVEGAASLDHGVMVGLEVAFEESDLPYTVDVVDLNGVSHTFRQIVEGQRVPLPSGGASDKVDGVWNELPFSEAVLVNPAVRFDRGAIYPFVDMAAVNADSRSVYAGEERPFKGSGSKFQSGDTLMARITPCLENGKIARYQAQGARQKGHGSTEFIVIRGRPNITDNDFAYYLTQWEEVRKYAIGQMTGTSGRQRVPVDSLDHLTVPLPPLPEQRAIAHILGTLDDKIELNRRMNQTLEAMARAVFQDWFVDFGPVRAKLDGREPYLPPDLWSLFPDRLVDSELGEIPEGWEVRAFGQLLSDVIGGDWGKETPDPTNTEPVSIIRGTDIPNLRNGGVGSVPLRYTTKKKVERRILHHGDIVIEVSGGSPTQPTGRSMLVTRDILERFPTTVVCASFCRRFRPRGWADGLLAAQHLDYANSIGKMWDYQLQSTGISNFQTKRFLGEEQIIWPGDAMAGEFANAIDPIVKHATRNESRTLTAQRDALLPKLVLGEIKMDRIYG